jgi:hypothetical protein
MAKRFVFGIMDDTQNGVSSMASWNIDHLFRTDEFPIEVQWFHRFHG